MANTTKHTFGFVGLGNMGIHMSHNLASYAEKQGFPKIQVWNRTRSKIEHMSRETYCEITDSIEQLVEKCDIIHGCLGNDEAALSIYRQVFKVKKEKLIVLDHSTLFPTTSTTLQEEASNGGITFLSCPIFGPPEAAKTAGLLIVVSGNAEARAVVKEYMVPAIGKSVIDCGEDTAKGALLKVLGNNCILGTIELLSESFALAEKTGFDTHIFYDFIRKFLFVESQKKTFETDRSLIEQWFPAPSWVNYGKKIRDGTFSSTNGFSITGGMKDASFVRRLGAETSTPTPIIDQAWNHLTTAKSLGGDSLDWSSCAAGMRASAGLPPWVGEDFSLASKDKKDAAEDFSNATAS